MINKGRFRPNLHIPPAAIIPQTKDSNADRSQSPANRIVLNHILMCAGKSGVVWKSNETLAQECGLSCVTVKRALTQLVKDGKLASIRTNQGKTGMRYLCPWPTRAEDVQNQLLDAGIKLIPPAGSNRYHRDATKTDGKAPPPQEIEVGQEPVIRTLENDTKETGSNVLSIARAKRRREAR